jgi:hypothetical protein
LEGIDAQITALSAGQILQAPAGGAADTASSILGSAFGPLPAPGSAAEKRGEAISGGALIGGVNGGLLGIPGD